MSFTADTISVRCSKIPVDQTAYQELRSKRMWIFEPSGPFPGSKSENPGKKAVARRKSEETRCRWQSLSLSTNECILKQIEVEEEATPPIFRVHKWWWWSFLWVMGIGLL